jgi:hypothetical protein
VTVLIGRKKRFRVGQQLPGAGHEILVKKVRLATRTAPQEVIDLLSSFVA